MSFTHDLSTHAAENRRKWNDEAARWVDPGVRNWSLERPVWGQWEIPEVELGLLPNRMDGMQAIELGCGTAYVSGWMGRRGADVVGVDISEGQLATARRLADEHGAPVRLLHADAEHVPLSDASFDFAISEYGAALWCEPRAWLGEARRLLRARGRLVFLSSHPIVGMCYPLDGSPSTTSELQRAYFELGRLDWTRVPEDPGGIEFVPTLGEWFRTFAEVGFAVVDYLELQAPPDARGTPFSVSAEWARRWPSEHVWIVDAV